jgi:hypothetical protein
MRPKEPACASQAAKGNPLVMHKRLREPTCDAQTAKGKTRKLITCSFSEHSENYAGFGAMYIKILSSNIKITTKLKNFKTVSAHAESRYRFDIVGHKKALKIWCDSPFKYNQTAEGGVVGGGGVVVAVGSF